MKKYKCRIIHKGRFFKPLLQNTKGNLNKHICEYGFFCFFAACREGMFGRNCQQPCGSDLNCKGLRFCLPDPYGCSCASGWFGTRCETRKCENANILSSCIAHHIFLLLMSACPNDMYGPDCKLSCKCQNGGVCKRFSGCTCPTGWRGQSCEKSGGFHIKSSCPLSSTTSTHYCIAAA